MFVDLLSAASRALSFIAQLQAAGLALAFMLFRHHLQRSVSGMRALAFASALAGIVLVALQFGLEPARMAGAMAGTMDVSLWSLVMHSSLSEAAGWRVVGLVLIAATARRTERAAVGIGVIGALCVAVAFATVGHTTESSSTWLRAVLVVHVLIVAFWFGSLPPLIALVKNEQRAHALAALRSFTRIATACVPIVFVAGLAMAILLLPEWRALQTTYGVLLLGKIAGFATLMLLAALNKWRHVPAIERGDTGSFCRVAQAEFHLICLVLIVTAVMTTFFSPTE